MQKKSLLVALFCGALCLTGCLKNEESASVEQVRLAKAEELKASAALKNAQAQAEVIYANAEATLKQAQAALLNAQAETEKVRAQLLAVQVKLQEVKVEEEKVELQKKQAELEVLLAQAEAGKQFWINALNNLLAQAEIDAIENAQDLLDAIAAFENNSAEGAAEYAEKYFDALLYVQDLQLEEIRVKAEKILVEAGVKAAKKAIDYQIEQIDNKIAENEAIIAALKARQTMTPEEAKAALTEARVALGDAYADYKDALEASDKAWSARNEVWYNKGTEYRDNWNTFRNLFANTFGYSEEYLVSDVFEEAGLDNNKIWKAGLYDNDGEFVPVWNSEVVRYSTERYPGGEVYSYSDAMLETPVIQPIAIDYENLKSILNQKVENLEEMYTEAIVDFAEDLADEVEWNQEIIAANNERLAIHKKYVDSRKAKVEAAEAKFLADLDKKQAADDKEAAAWTDFQEYWLMKYDASRQLVIDRYNAEKAYNEKKAVSDAKLTALDNKKATLPTLKDAITAAKEAEIKANGDYNVALGSQKDDGEAAALEAALLKYNPDFNAATAKKKDGKWVNEVKDKADIVAGTDQAAVLDKNEVVKAKQDAFDEAEENLQRHPKGSKDYTTYKTAYDTAETELDEATTAYNTAVTTQGKSKTAYENAKKAYDAVYGPAEDAKKVWDEKKKAFADAEKAYNDAKTDTESGKTYTEWKTADDATKAAKATLDAKEAALKDAIGAKNDAEATKKYEAYLTAKAEAAEAGTSWADLSKLYYGYSKDDVDPGDENDYNSWYDYDGNVFGWINSNYQLDYNATMLNSKGETVLIAKEVFGVSYTPWEEVFDPYWNGSDFDYDDYWVAGEEKIYGPYWNNLTFENEELQNFIDAVPVLLAWAAEWAEEDVEDLQEDVDEIIAAAADVKAKEASYMAWTKERIAAYEPINEARKAVHDTYEVMDAARADYQALEAVANGKFYVYDPDNDDADGEGFVELSVNEAIESLEGNVGMLYNALQQLIGVVSGDFDLDDLQIYDEQGKSIFELTLVKKVLEKAKQYGEVTADVVIEMLDDQIKYIEEEIEIWTAIANKYKTVLYAYLNIDEEAAAEEE